MTDILKDITAAISNGSGNTTRLILSYGTLPKLLGLKRDPVVVVVEKRSSGGGRNRGPGCGGVWGQACG